MPRASSSETGPIAAIGRSSPSTRRTRPGRRSTRGASSVEARQPLAPRRALRPRRQLVDHRQREGRQVREVARCRARSAPTRGESGSSRCASRSCPSNSPRRPRSRRRQRSGSPPMTAESTISFSHFHGARSVPATTHVVVVRLEPSMGRSSLELLRRRLDAREAGDRIVCRHGGLGCARGLAGVRHLPERQVFGEPERRQALDRAREHGEKRPARRDAAGGRRARTSPECRRDRRHLRAGRRSRPVLRSTTAISIEAHAGARLLQDPAGDFDALAALAGRREHAHFAGRLAFGRLPAGEQVAAQRREIGRGDGLEHLGLDAERLRDDRAWRDRRTAPGQAPGWRARSGGAPG